MQGGISLNHKYLYFNRGRITWWSYLKKVRKLK
ncbi:hypothetical protein ES705_30231 [subsurface metagenome]